MLIYCCSWALFAINIVSNVCLYAWFTSTVVLFTGYWRVLSKNTHTTHKCAFHIDNILINNRMTCLKWQDKFMYLTEFAMFKFFLLTNARQTHAKVVWLLAWGCMLWCKMKQGNNYHQHVNMEQIKILCKMCLIIYLSRHRV